MKYPVARGTVYTVHSTQKRHSAGSGISPRRECEYSCGLTNVFILIRTSYLIRRAKSRGGAAFSKSQQDRQTDRQTLSFAHERKKRRCEILAKVQVSSSELSIDDDVAIPLQMPKNKEEKPKQQGNRLTLSSPSWISIGFYTGIPGVIPRKRKSPNSSEKSNTCLTIRITKIRTPVSIDIIIILFH